MAEKIKSTLLRIFGTNTSFKKDWKHVTIGFTILVILTSGINVLAALIGFFFSPSIESAAESSLSPENIHIFFMFYLSVFPLALTSTVLILIYIDFCRALIIGDTQRYAGSLYQIIVTTAAVLLPFFLLFAMWVGALLGIGGVSISDLKPFLPHNWFLWFLWDGPFLFNKLLNFLTAKYGLFRSILSIVTGGFTAWALYFKIFPHFFGKRNP